MLSHVSGPLSSANPLHFVPSGLHNPDQDRHAPLKYVMAMNDFKQTRCNNLMPNMSDVNVQAREYFIKDFGGADKTTSDKNRSGLHT